MRSRSTRRTVGEARTRFNSDGLRRALNPVSTRLNRCVMRTPRRASARASDRAVAGLVVTTIKGRDTGMAPIAQAAVTTYTTSAATADRMW